MSIYSRLLLSRLTPDTARAVPQTPKSAGRKCPALSEPSSGASTSTWASAAPDRPTFSSLKGASPREPSSEASCISTTQARSQKLDKIMYSKQPAKYKAHASICTNSRSLRSFLLPVSKAQEDTSGSAGVLSRCKHLEAVAGCGHDGHQRSTDGAPQKDALWTLGPAEDGLQKARDSRS